MEAPWEPHRAHVSPMEAPWAPWRHVAPMRPMWPHVAATALIFVLFFVDFQAPEGHWIPCKVLVVLVVSNPIFGDSESTSMLFGIPVPNQYQINTISVPNQVTGN